MMVVAVAVLLAVLTAVHGVLKPMLGARGISPWNVKDSLAAAPTVWLGCVLIGAGVGLELWEWRSDGSWSVRAAALALIVAGWLAELLGITELRKLH